MIERDVLASTREFARESRTQSWIAVGSTFALLALCTVTAFVARPWPVRVIASLLEALLIVRAFILFHDFQHNAILRGSKIARAFFWTFGLTVLTPPRVWRDTHNYHHANNAKIVGSHVGSYPIVTVAMWSAMSPAQRMAYRIARHPLTIALGYFTVFAWGMCVSPLLRAPKKNRSAVLALAFQVLAAIVLVHAFGVDAWLYAVFAPLVLAMALGSYLFYAQHNFEGMELRARENWSYVAAALTSSSYMPLGPIGRYFTGNIGYHHVHHLNPGIPFYRLPEAMAAIEELQTPHETRLRWHDISAGFRGDVWDSLENEMISFERADERARARRISTEVAHETA
ncbi:MAG TPA: fatty acid desaturase [Polyangiaceae bacterium]